MFCYFWCVFCVDAVWLRFCFVNYEPWIEDWSVATGLLFVVKLFHCIVNKGFKNHENKVTQCCHAPKVFLLINSSALNTELIKKNLNDSKDHDY